MMQHTWYTTRYNICALGFLKGYVLTNDIFSHVIEIEANLVMLSSGSLPIASDFGHKAHACYVLYTCTFLCEVRL